MSPFMVGFLTASLFLSPLVVFIVWCGVCNERTYLQRVAMRRKCPALMSGATYHEHFWALVYLRDPRKLYQRVRDETDGTELAKTTMTFPPSYWGK